MNTSTDEIKNKKLSFKKDKLKKLKKKYKIHIILMLILFIIFLIPFFVDFDVGVLLITVVFYSLNNIFIRNIFYVDISKEKLDDFDIKKEVFSKKMTDLNDLFLITFALAVALKKLWELDISSMFIYFLIIGIVILFLFAIRFIKDRNSYWYDEEE